MREEVLYYVFLNPRKLYDALGISGIGETGGIWGQTVIDNPLGGLIGEAVNGGPVR